MAETVDVLEDFKVEWGDFDRTYSLLDDPEVGLALVTDPPQCPPVRPVLAAVEAAYEKLAYEGRIRFDSFGQEDSLATAEADLKLFSEPVTETDLLAQLDREVQVAILKRLGDSITLRREVATRLVEHCREDVKGQIKTLTTPQLHPPLVSELEPRIDYLFLPDESERTIHRRFNPEPHYDGTVLTEHRGSTRPGLELVLPGAGELQPYNVPDGYRLMSRGEHWMHARTANHLPTIHAVREIDWNHPRTRWVLLWRCSRIMATRVSNDPAAYYKGQANILDRMRQLGAAPSII